jgi:hypothetical protein
MTKSNAHPEMDCILWILCTYFFYQSKTKSKFWSIEMSEFSGAIEELWYLQKSLEMQSLLPLWEEIFPLSESLTWTQGVMCWKPDHYRLMPVILATWEGGWNQEIIVWGQPGQIVQDPISIKITRAKWIGGVAQVVEGYFVSVKPWVQIPVP